MTWELEYLPEALSDLDALDNSIRQPVIKGIKKVLKNPVSKEEGGYGTPLGNKEGNNLTGLFKINIYASYMKRDRSTVNDLFEFIIFYISVCY